MPNYRENLPSELRDWLERHGASAWEPETAEWPGVEGRRYYVLVTLNYSTLRVEFGDHDYNPRTPDPGRVMKLLASIRKLSMLTPLTCAYIENREREPVVLIDGRHRFDALQKLAEEDPDWAQRGRVDVKVFYQLTKSELHVLATYLNRTRRPLKKGEYYKAIVKIFDEKQGELEAESGRLATEREIFTAVPQRSLTSRDFDLSIGRIVGLTAFREEEGDSWFPYVGLHQHDKFRSAAGPLYTPVTAGNLAEFLRYLCYSHPYSDDGEKRAVEIGNVLKLGSIFRQTILREPRRSAKDVTFSTVGSKFWSMAALGSLMKDWIVFTEPSGEGSILSEPEVDWDQVPSLLELYTEIMAEQARIIREYKKTKDFPTLKRAWSYQTQRDQVRRPLQKAFEKQGYSFRSRA